MAISRNPKAGLLSLVIGQQDYRVVGESGLSNKQKKAMEFLNKGQDIEILSESEFLSMI